MIILFIAIALAFALALYLFLSRKETEIQNPTPGQVSAIPSRFNRPMGAESIGASGVGVATASRSWM